MVRNLTLSLAGMLLVGLVLVGCSATPLGMAKYSGEPIAKALTGSGPSLLEVESKDDALHVTVILPDNSTCEGDFKIIDQRRGYFIGSATAVVYSGTWNAGLSDACQKQIGATGGPEERRVWYSSQVLIHTTPDQMSLCTKGSGLICVPTSVYRIKRRKS